jgi:hypothetical protein
MKAVKKPKIAVSSAKPLNATPTEDNASVDGYESVKNSEDEARREEDEKSRIKVREQECFKKAYWGTWETISWIAGRRPELLLELTNMYDYGLAKIYPFYCDVSDDEDSPLTFFRISYNGLDLRSLKR